MDSTLELELPLLLPEVEDERDQCVERLTERLASTKGITRAHARTEDGKAVLCLHYDPEATTLASVERIARQAGAEVADRYRHETLWIRGMDCADCAASVEHLLGRADGVIGVSVSYAAERMRVEYDARRIGHAGIVQRVGWMGYEVEEERPCAGSGATGSSCSRSPPASSSPSPSSGRRSSGSRALPSSPSTRSPTLPGASTPPATGWRRRFGFDSRSTSSWLSPPSAQRSWGSSRRARCSSSSSASGMPSSTSPWTVRGTRSGRSGS